MGPVLYGLADADEVREAHVDRAHREGLCGWVDVADFMHEGGVICADDGGQPFWGRLLARDEAFCAELDGGALVWDL